MVLETRGHTGQFNTSHRQFDFMGERWYNKV